jgi:formylglycine-generating enzyme required for sulfatase activity
MSDATGTRSRKKTLLLLGTGMVLGFLIVYGANAGIVYTSTDVFCDKFCHVHPHVTASWIKSTHYTTKSGVVTHCIECHLPAGGIEYYTEKARLGAQDVWGVLTKDLKKIDWEAKGSLEHAVTFTYESSCIRCHSILFSSKLTKKGSDAHLYYQRMQGKILCLNCHLSVGHYHEKKPEEYLETKDDVFDPKAYPATAEGFTNYTEVIPGSDVKFEMVALPGGTFTMGSPDSEEYRNPDEGPQRQVQLTQFWIGRTEVRWKEWEVFYAQRGSPGKNDPSYSEESTTTGPTPSYGSPDQGWGRGARPAITMTHHSATVYCQWLSSVTGKKYRLPTEAEWEYACRSKTGTPYFFPGDPADFTLDSFWNRVFGAKKLPLSQFAAYAGGGSARTQTPSYAKPNPFGLIHTIGNVREFCLDWYDPQAYAKYPSTGAVLDPRGPEGSEEHVVRGGSFKSDAIYLRSAARDRTQTERWMMTDPQSPKSIWWYSDCNDVGFRVVREYEPPK